MVVYTLAILVLGVWGYEVQGRVEGRQLVQGPRGTAQTRSQIIKALQFQHDAVILW